MRIQLVALLCLLGTARAEPDKGISELFQRYEAYMLKGEGKAEEVFSERQIKVRPIAKGLLKGTKASAFDLQVRPSPRDPKRAYVKLSPKEEMSFVVVKQGNIWVIDGKHGDDEN
jgi:hypothetical protein